MATPGIPGIEPYTMPAPAELPENIVDWKVDPARVVLLIHDMQRYFLRAFPSGTGLVEALVANATRVRETCARRGIPVAYSTQPGSMTAEQRGLLMDFWGPGMRVDDADRAVVDPLAPSARDWKFTKWRYSAFFGSDLLARMRAKNRDQLIICGVYGHVGVLMTAIEAFTHDIQTFLVADAVADFSERYHMLALDYAAERCSAVLTTQALIEAL